MNADLIARLDRLETKARQVRALASGYRKRLLAGDRSVSVQDPQNAEAYASDLEVVCKALRSEAQHER